MPGTPAAAGLAQAIEDSAVVVQFRMPVVGPAEGPLPASRLVVAGKRGAIFAHHVVTVLGDIRSDPAVRPVPGAKPGAWRLPWPARR